MDPTQCCLDMYAAMRDGEWHLARELAEALKAWLASGGFYPPNYSRTEVDGYLANVLRRTCGIERDAFSLTCIRCDAGAEIGSMQEALTQGWSEIEHRPHLMEANYLGRTWLPS